MGKPAETSRTSGDGPLALATTSRESTDSTNKTWDVPSKKKYLCIHICAYVYVCIYIYVYVWSSVGQAPPSPRMGMGVQSCLLWFPPVACGGGVFGKLVMGGQSCFLWLAVCMWCM